MFCGQYLSASRVEKESDVKDKGKQEGGDGGKGPPQKMH